MEERTKSKFFTPLRTRDGLDYPEPGEWKRNTDYSKLATIAKNLDTSKATDRPDKLHSLPTPWARLLLFESALYDADHPSHNEIVSQWRGVLGLLALEDLLGLGTSLTCTRFTLSGEPTGDLQTAFMTLRPRYVVKTSADPEVRDVEEGKWNSLDLIKLDDVVLGATSPRTLVFTGVRHQCPQIVPFRTVEGQLMDPIKYYKEYDPKVLSVLEQWLDGLINAVKNDSQLDEFLGVRPSGPDAQPIRRRVQLIDALDEWRKTIGRIREPVQISLATSSRLSPRFSFIKAVKSPEMPRESDLFLRDHDDTIVCFRPEDNSVLLDPSGREITDQPIRIYGPLLCGTGRPLPREIAKFIPKEIKVIDNPAYLLEDTLLEAEVAHDAAYCLFHENKRYLLPFRAEILDWFSEQELAKLAQGIQIYSVAGTLLKLEMTIPLVGDKSIKVHREYHQDRDIISDYATQNLASWPDFVCTHRNEDKEPYFAHYFYYTSDVTPGRQIEFKPIGEVKETRGIPSKGRKWYWSRDPLKGFDGSIRNKHGLLLMKHKEIAPPNKKWSIGVDFGSTHTNVFYLELDEWSAAAGARIKPLSIKPRVRILTQCDEAEIQENFFLWAAGENEMSAQDDNKAITTVSQLILPVSVPEDYPNDWLPREGQVFLGSSPQRYSVLSNRLETDMKWNSDRDNYSTRAFLRSLMILVKAEAISNNSTIESVSRAYPTAFTQELKQKQIGEWAGVKRVVSVPVDDEPLSEAVAVCRHLWKEQNALTEVNTIALDIGGSTTDIAVWARKDLKSQESIKMAAGAISRYFALAPGFLSWFESTIESQPFNYSGDSALDIRGFHAVLKELEREDLIDHFINSVLAARTRDEVRPFLSHIALLFGALTYFAGLLTRKREMTDLGNYYLFFCGKGGQFLRWLPDAERLVQTLFSAGLFGPHATPDLPLPNVKVTISKFPKQEVGRGLLIEHALTVSEATETIGMLNEAKHTVTVAEDGYEGVSWKDNLTYQQLSTLPGRIPSLSELSEVNHFIRTFRESTLTQDVAEVLRITEVFPSDFYLGSLQQYISDTVANGENGALIEPLFITEVKVLIKLITRLVTERNDLNLFD